MRKISHARSLSRDRHSWLKPVPMLTYSQYRYSVCRSQTQITRNEFYGFKVGLIIKTVLKEYHKFFLISYSYYETIFRWFGEFKHGQPDFKDDEKNGSPKAASSNEKADKLKLILC